MNLAVIMFHIYCRCCSFLSIETEHCGKMVLEKASQVKRSTCPYGASQAIPWNNVLQKYKDVYTYHGIFSIENKLSVTPRTLLAAMGPDNYIISDNCSTAVKKVLILLFPTSK